MNKKIKVGLIYGGQSFEHEVSKMTAESILENIDQDKFEVTKIYIDKDGKLDESLLKDVEVAFLAVHGPNCEDGKLQKYLEEKGIKYTGSGVEASALNMDKVKMHDAFVNADILVVEYFDCNKNTGLAEIDEKITGSFGYPVFVKANNAGSSVGVSKAEDISELKEAVEEAVKCDDGIIIEEAVKNPREVEVAILGNDKLTMSDPGEVSSHGEFYSYDAKYFHPFNTETRAELLPEQIKTIKQMAEKAYRATGCKGYSRIDFLVDESGKIYLNEINTLPGFTKISMFPKLMAEAGISYKDLISKIIYLALD